MQLTVIGVLDLLLILVASVADNDGDELEEHEFEELDGKTKSRPIVTGFEAFKNIT